MKFLKEEKDNPLFYWTGAGFLLGTVSTSLATFFGVSAWIQIGVALLVAASLLSVPSMKKLEKTYGRNRALAGTIGIPNGFITGNLIVLSVVFHSWWLPFVILVVAAGAGQELFSYLGGKPALSVFKDWD